MLPDGRATGTLGTGSSGDEGRLDQATYDGHGANLIRAKVAQDLGPEAFFANCLASTLTRLPSHRA